MFDGEQDASRVIWGHPVPKKSNGRYMWPEQIKVMAAERVAAGATIAEVARELTANESLVGHWIRNLRGGKPVRQAKPEPSAPEIIEIIGIDDLPGSTTGTGSCIIQIGDTRLTIGPGYPAAHLTEILRAVRASK